MARQGPHRLSIQTGNPAVDDFPFIIGNDAGIQRLRPDLGAGGREVGDGRIDGRKDAVVVVHGHTEREGLSGLVDDVHRTVRPGDFHARRRNRRNRRSRCGIVGVRDHFNAVFHPLGRKDVEHGDGLRSKARIVIAGFGLVLRSISHQPIVSGRQRGGQFQPAGTAAVYQRHLAGSRQHPVAMEFDIGNVADRGRRPFCDVHTEGGIPEQIARHIDIFIGRQIGPFNHAVAGLGDQGGKQHRREEKRNLFHHHLWELGHQLGLSFVPPRYRQSTQRAGHHS